jgi:hypothetical protein
MENRARRWAATVATAGALCGAIVAPASAEPTRRIVLHVCFGDAPTPQQMDLFEQAQKHATEIYDAIGVTLVWTTDRVAAGTDAGVMHLNLSVLADDRTDRLMRKSFGLPKTVLGIAPHETGRVYLFWDRIVRHARTHEVLFHVVLGRVIAHEVGHHLLPAQGHSHNGLMQASLNYRLPRPPAFTDRQAGSIRALLVAAN